MVGRSGLWPGAEHFGRYDFFSTSANDYFLLKRKQKEMLAEGNEILSEVEEIGGAERKDLRLESSSDIQQILFFFLSAT